MEKKSRSNLAISSEIDVSGSAVIACMVFPARWKGCAFCYCKMLVSLWENNKEGTTSKACGIESCISALLFLRVQALFHCCIITIFYTFMPLPEISCANTSEPNPSSHLVTRCMMPSIQDRNAAFRRVVSEIRNYLYVSRHSHSFSLADSWAQVMFYKVPSFVCNGFTPRLQARFCVRRLVCRATCHVLWAVFLMLFFCVLRSSFAWNGTIVFTQVSFSILYYVM